MAYALAIVAVIAFFAVLHFFTELKAKMKIGMAVALLFITIFAMMYNAYSEKQRRHALDVELRYKQGKTLVCNGMDVNSTNFSFSTGTHTFIGRKGTPHYSMMINTSACQ